jgi:mono/diheme cytochrome c family protein
MMTSRVAKWQPGGVAKCACRLSCLLVAGAGLAVLPGCRGDRSDNPPRQFFPDMEDTPRWNPQSASQFFADGRTMRPPVEGTVPHSRWAYHEAAVMPEPFNAQRQDLLREDAAYYRGTGPEGAYIERIPIPVDADLILRGQERFNIYCAVCHGYAGDGQGMVGVRWSAPVPSFHTPELQDPQAEGGRGTDGYLFHTAMNGVVRPDGSPSMPPYGHALSARDGWAVAAYIRVLQESRKGQLEDVPEPRRQQLLAEPVRQPSAPSALPGPGQPPPPSPITPEPHTPGVTPPAITDQPVEPAPPQPAPAQPQETPRQNP